MAAIGGNGGNIEQTIYELCAELELDLVSAASVPTARRALSMLIRALDVMALLTMIETFAGEPAVGKVAGIKHAAEYVREVIRRAEKNEGESL